MFREGLILAGQPFFVYVYSFCCFKKAKVPVSYLNIELNNQNSDLIY
ncbi:hypothetical protein HNQ81_002111 [Desulfoprunum benzoelyticum]|uniref:Uncharacterized protein n=1 Tax=Desulfoprunum benzoelyticum TaxID=1506996 RepID=A0A840UU65_9BACT|nr:hypothetical protein [Desulfoprunum benzoelyticum]